VPNLPKLDTCPLNRKFHEKEHKTSLGKVGDVGGAEPHQQQQQQLHQLHQQHQHQQHQHQRHQPQQQPHQQQHQQQPNQPATCLHPKQTKQRDFEMRKSTRQVAARFSWQSQLENSKGIAQARSRIRIWHYAKIHLCLVSKLFNPISSITAFGSKISNQ
jgi:acetyl/propionyl-CoA carboxylase alpha subunit